MTNPLDWKAKEADTAIAPDPLTFRAFLSEMEKGMQTAEDEYAQNPNPMLDQFPAGEAQAAASEIIVLMKRLQQHGYNVRTNPRRFAAKLSGLCSQLVYNLGKIEGYKKAQSP